jgi:DivIVA domain-containing protein
MVNLLTPNDVHNTQFDVRHLQGGYDMDEVDTFLEDVETTIRALTDWMPSRTPRRKPRYRYAYRKAHHE